LVSMDWITGKGRVSCMWKTGALGVHLRHATFGDHPGGTYLGSSERPIRATGGLIK
jgi:hypothetical protein